MANVIYQKSYQTVEQADIEKNDPDLDIDINPADIPQTIEDLIHDYKSKITVVELPDRIAQANAFIDRAIYVGELYQLDTRITHHQTHYTVDYFFDCSGAMSALQLVLAHADDYSFFTPAHGRDICMSIDYYTHAIYRGDMLIHPIQWERELDHSKPSTFPQ